ncbi:AmmeMemoRadiSam system protein B [Candidatus Woesearchaeota archaeon]|nr:MAG: AmmeMemoRadiSam system protein B [Candidatus Woesearchaeota archaeon]
MKKILIILLLMVLLGCQTQVVEEKKVVRESAIAGSWYPNSEEEINKTLSNYFNNVEDAGLENIKAIIVPHAGWRFSGRVAAAAFKQLVQHKKDYNTVLILGPSHTSSFDGASIPNATHYETPLGLVKVSDKTKQLLAEPLFNSYNEAHKKEHSIEIELPFLQYALSNFEIIPVLIGPRTTVDEINSIASTLKKYVDNNTLIVVSSDFTHYGPRYGYIPFTENVSDNIKFLDSLAIDRIKAKDAEGFAEFLSETGATICGRHAVLALLFMLQGEDITPQLISYDTSGNITGDYKNSVSYVSMVFTEPKKEPLTKDEQEFLLKLARDTLNYYYGLGEKPVIDESELSPNLKKIQGCFTTLNKNYNLRGCIGHILPQEELYKCVMDNVISAAVNDRRFLPVRADELDDIKIEISVLSVPEPLEFSSGEDLKNKLRPLVDGVVLRNGMRQSTYLPQVWEQLPDKELFLTSLCKKGGMREDCWKDTSTKVSTYQAFVFEEE